MYVILFPLIHFAIYYYYNCVVVLLLGLLPSSHDQVKSNKIGKSCVFYPTNE